MSINITELTKKGEEGNANAKTVEEFELTLQIYKEKNPEKYAVKLASGEFERQRIALGIDLSKSEKIENTKESEQVEEVKKRGRHKKEE